MDQMGYTGSEAEIEEIMRKFKNEGDQPILDTKKARSRSKTPTNS
jgi:hypothetical protein